MLRHLPLCILLIAVFVPDVLASSNFFADYPSCAANQLSALFPATCDFGTDTVSQQTRSDRCLCHDANFFKEAALAVHNNCDCPDLVNAANTAVDNCKKLGITPAMNATQIITYVDGSTDCTTAKQQDQGATQQSKKQNASLDKANQIALGVGLGIGLPTILIGAAALYYQYRASRRKREMQPEEKLFTSG